MFSFQRVALCLRISLGCLGNFMGPSRPTTQWKATQSHHWKALPGYEGWPVQILYLPLLGVLTGATLTNSEKFPLCYVSPPPLNVPQFQLSFYPLSPSIPVTDSSCFHLPHPCFQSTSRIFSISNSQGDPCFPQSPHLCLTSLGLWIVDWLSYTQ